MITMLGCLEVDIEVSDTGIETIESDNYKGISENNRDINGMLVVIWEKARFSHKDEQNFINLFI